MKRPARLVICLVVLVCGLLAVPPLRALLAAGRPPAPTRLADDTAARSWRPPARTGATAAGPARSAVARPKATSKPVPRHRSSSSADSLSSDLTRDLAASSGHAAVAVLDLTDGATLQRGDTAHHFVTASIAKVDILAALLLQRQDEGRSTLSSAQRGLATSMIEQSDNAAANSLFRQAGSSWGLSLANRRLGLTDTSVPDPCWGLTRTTAADQLRLLQAVFTDRSALNRSSRALLQELMGQVESDQAWGVSAAGLDSPTALKNGWLPRPDGTWSVNSIGRVGRSGHILLVAVLTDRQPTEDSGIALVERVARAAAFALVPSVGRPAG
ncbi:beta-lactamase class A [Streptacidiphilus sp. MAP12-33]|uniref:serine hydrolase n=1 Tax=Streptacidiphilus sp. MAP12-33 TaxID=3156266 RepID=UPI003511CCCF